jgi:hypothetical protein
VLRGTTGCGGGCEETVGALVAGYKSCYNKTAADISSPNCEREGFDDIRDALGGQGPPSNYSFKRKVLI